MISNEKIVRRLVNGYFEDGHVQGNRSLLTLRDVEAVVKGCLPSILLLLKDEVRDIVRELEDRLKRA